MYKSLKVTALLLCLCALLSLCACGTKAAGDSTVPAAAPEAVSASPAPDNSAVKPADTALTGEVQYELNTFLSLFAEQYFEGFSDFDADFEQIVDFMHIYLKLHEFGTVKLTPLPNGKIYESIEFDTANEVFLRFFDRSADYSRASGYVKAGYDGDMVYGMFYDGKFCFEPASGENCARIAIVDRCTPAGEDRYEIEFTVYGLDIQRFLDDNGISDEYYHLYAAEAASRTELTAVQHCRAVVFGTAGNLRIASYEITQTLY